MYIKILKLWAPPKKKPSKHVTGYIVYWPTSGLIK